MKQQANRVMLTIKDQVYQVIKENILSEHYKPGDRLHEVHIAKELNVSRSPVRSAINELIGEGLLESKPNKFVKVKQLTEKEILDTYEFRLVLEKYALEKLIINMNDRIDRELADFRRQFQNCQKYEQLLEYVELDNRFHNYIIESSGNNVVVETLRRIGILVTPFRVISLKSQERFIQSIEEHTGLIDAVRAKDLPMALKYSQTHLLLAKDEVIAYLRSHAR